MPALCKDGWLEPSACDAMLGKFGANSQYGLAYEVTDTGAGWFGFHHHHHHVSLNGNIPSGPSSLLIPGPARTASQRVTLLRQHGIAGHGTRSVVALGRQLPGAKR